jgi:dsDNA-specific endonuclease/ATPase MutS2
MEEVRVARTAAEELRVGAEAQLDEARERIVELEDVRGDLDRRSEQLEAEAQKGIEERVRDGLRKVVRARALLSQVPKETALSLGKLLDELEADLTGATLSERRAAFLSSLRKGSLVYLPRYRQRVLVHKINAAKREVVCKLGGMKLHVTFEEVTPYESL